MNSIIKIVFQTLGMLLLSLILYGIIFGSTGRTAMWSVIAPAMELQWSRTTLQDGMKLAEITTLIFEDSQEFMLR